LSNETHTFDPFCNEPAYIKLNHQMIDRLLRQLKGLKSINVLDVAAGTGLMSQIALEKAAAAGAKLRTTLLDFDLPALKQARIELENSPDAQYIFGSADTLPFVPQNYDAIIFANFLHLLDNESKEKALAEGYRVLKPGGVLAMNSTFYEGAYPEESKPFYSRWIRRAIMEINRRLPNRSKGEKVQAMEFLPSDRYQELINGAGFKVVEVRERRALLSQSAVRAISSYMEFAKGALHATDEDAEQAAQALQVTVKQTFNELRMKYLPRNWLEIVAVKA